MMNFLNKTDMSWEIPSLEIFSNKLKITSKFFYLYSREFHHETPRGNESD